jgi:acyl carrier protein
MREQLKELLADLLGCAPGEIPEDADLGALEGWDSLRHLELMLELEAEFNIRIPTQAMAELISLSSIEQYLDGDATDDRPTPEQAGSRSCP